MERENICVVAFVSPIILSSSCDPNPLPPLPLHTTEGLELQAQGQLY